MKIRSLLNAFIFLNGAAFSSMLYAQTVSFDFNVKPAAKSQAIKPDTIYTVDTGYGFENGAQILSTRTGVSSTIPFLFSVAVPEENYRVKVTLGDADSVSETTVKAETRRLMLEKVVTQKGERVDRSFVVNVRRPAIAGGGEVD